MEDAECAITGRVVMTMSPAAKVAEGADTAVKAAEDAVAEAKVAGADPNTIAGTDVVEGRAAGMFGWL